MVLEEDQGTPGGWQDFSGLPNEKMQVLYFIHPKLIHTPPTF